MRHFIVLVSLLLLSACAQISTKIPPPPSAKTKVAVFDIDGTLTPKKTAIYAVRTKAPSAVKAYADAGYKIIYLSARFPLFQFNIKEFLTENDFPHGDVQVPTWSQAFIPPDQFKSSILIQYTGVDWSQAYGFGDSNTDYLAYRETGIPNQHIIGLRRTNETKCEIALQNACLKDWSKPLPGIGF